MKETLEEAFQKWSRTQASYDKIDVLKFGAKWQAERMYSEEESIQKIIDYVDFQFNTNGELDLEIKKWFEQFKKK